MLILSHNYKCYILQLNCTYHAKIIFILTIVAMLNSCSKEEVATPDPGNTTSSKLTDITTLSNYDATIKTGVSLLFFMLPGVLSVLLRDLM